MRKGLAGIVSFSFGGMLLFQLLDVMSHFDAGTLIIPFPVLFLLALVLIVLGLWLIIKDEKLQRK
jgi:hypothetical protein